MKKLILLLMFFLVINLVSAQIGVREVLTQPEKVAPGERFTVRIFLENVGDDDINDVSVKLVLNDLPFAPVDSSSEKLIDEIRDGDSEQITFSLVALPEAEPRIYKIPLKISYNNTVNDALISVNIESNPNIDMVLESSEVVKVGDNGKIIIKIINLGLSEIKTFRLTLLQTQDYEILSSNVIYIGDIDSEDFETAEFTIIPKVSNPKLLFNLNYRDINNIEYAENNELTLSVYTLEEAKQLGLVKNNIFFTILIPILILLIAYFIYKRLRKRKI